MVIATPAEAVQNESGKNSLERQRREYTRGGPGACSPGKFSFSKMHILRILIEM